MRFTIREQAWGLIIDRWHHLTIAIRQVAYLLAADKYRRLTRPIF